MSNNFSLCSKLDDNKLTGLIDDWYHNLKLVLKQECFKFLMNLFLEEPVANVGEEAWEVYKSHKDNTTQALRIMVASRLLN